MFKKIHKKYTSFIWKWIRQTFKRLSSTIVQLRAHQEERAEYYWLDTHKITQNIHIHMHVHIVYTLACKIDLLIVTYMHTKLQQTNYLVYVK